MFFAINRKVVITVAVATAIGLALGYLRFGAPDAAFQSSDGQWADSELQLKGRSFKRVVLQFELYKVRCGAPDAELLRVTQEEWFNVFAWPSYVTDKKWRVPLGKMNPQISRYTPRASDQGHCMNRAGGEDEWATAKTNASIYIEAL